MLPCQYPPPLLPPSTPTSPIWAELPNRWVLLSCTSVQPLTHTQTAQGSTHIWVHTHHLLGGVLFAEREPQGSNTSDLLLNQVTHEGSVEESSTSHPTSHLRTTYTHIHAHTHTHIHTAEPLNFCKAVKGPICEFGLKQKQTSLEGDRGRVMGFSATVPHTHTHTHTHAYMQH